MLDILRIQGEPPAAFIGKEQVELVQFSDNLESEIRTVIPYLKPLKIKDYVPLLMCELVLDGEFSIAEATRCSLYRGRPEEGCIELCISFGDRHGVWKGNIAVGAVYKELHRLPDIETMKNEFSIDFEDSTLYFSKELSPNSEENLFETVANFIHQVQLATNQINERLFGFTWDSEYEKNEPLFTKEVVIPVLRKLGFESVRYNHGVNEFGRDILFSELDKFGRIRHCAAQVKAGDITASNGTLLSTLLSQIDDAFALPVDGPGKSKQFNISEVFVICSGRITEGAIRRLNQKLDPRLAGSIHFLDRDDIDYFAKSLWPLA